MDKKYEKMKRATVFLFLFYLLSIGNIQKSRGTLFDRPKRVREYQSNAFFFEAYAGAFIVVGPVLCTLLLEEKWRRFREPHAFS